MGAQPLLSPLLDWLIILLSVGLPGGAGGVNDPRLLRIVPPDAVVALEWSSRTPTPEGGDRFQEFLADPEIRRATAALQLLRDHAHPCSSALNDPSLTGLRDRWPAVAQELWRYPGCLYVAWEPDLGGKLIPRAAIVLNVGGQPDAARKALRAVLPAWMIMEDGQALIPNALWHFRVVGSYFIWSLGTESGDKVAAALQQPVTNPPANPALLAAVETWDVPRPGHRLWINLPLDEWRQKAPALWERTPLAAIAELMPSWRSLSVLGSDDAGLMQRTAWLSSPARPVATWFTPLSTNTTRLIPKDAHYAASAGASMPDIARWCAAAAAHVPMLPPDAPQHWQQRIETELGLKLSDDVLPALGSTWTIYSAPSTGGPFGVSPVISLDVRDPRQAYVAFSQLMHVIHRHVKESADVTFHEELFLDRTIATLQFRGPRSLPLAPSFCITDKQLLVTLQPQTMRAHLRFLAGGGESFAHRADAALPADARGFFYVDSPALMQVLWPLLPLVGNQPLNQLRTQGIAIDGGVIPSSSAVLPHVQPAWGVLRQTDTALVAEMRHPLSAAAPVLTAVALLGLAQEQDHSSAETAVPSDLGSPSIDLGTPEGELTTNNDTPASALDAIPSPTRVEPIPTVVPPNSRRVWLSGLIRAVTPDDVESAIPNSVFDRIERGPTPEELQRREERRKAREARKKPLPR